MEVTDIEQQVTGQFTPQMSRQFTKGLLFQQQNTFGNNVNTFEATN